MDTTYTESFGYEILIRRAFNCGRGEHGADSALMKNLLEAENGKRHSFLPSREKQLLTVKKNLLKAIDKFLTNRKIIESRGILSGIRNQIESAGSGAELLTHIEKVLTITPKE